MVLLYNSRLDKQWSKTSDNRWNGPYLIMEVKESRSIYLLSELDRIVMNGVFLGEHLKQVYLRRGIAADKRDVEPDDGGDRKVIEMEE